MVHAVATFLRQAREADKPALLTVVPERTLSVSRALPANAVQRKRKAAIREGLHLFDGLFGVVSINDGFWV